MKGYKAFYRYKNGFLRCRYKLYKVGKTYEEPAAELCMTGMHFCERCIDCFIFYDPSHAVICEVEAPDECVRGNANELLPIAGPMGYNSKLCTTKLKVIREVPYDEVWKLCNKEYIDLRAEFGYDRDKRSPSKQSYLDDLSDIRNRVVDELRYRNEEDYFMNTLYDDSCT